MNRRDFIKMTAAGASAALAGTKLLGADAPGAPAKKPAKGEVTVAMPISAAPLVQPDFERMLADMRDRGGVNALLPFIYTHETHRAGVEGDFPNFRGGNYAIPHMQYYKDVPFTYGDMRATEFGDVDALARAIPLAQKYGIKVFPWVIEDNHCPAIPNWVPLYEIDYRGRRATGNPAGPCKNNPAYRGYLENLLEDYIRSYDIGGIMWGAERQSGFLNMLGGNGDVNRGTCFCEYCQKRARSAGIDVERARKGFVEIDKLARARKASRRPRDGYFTSFWRVLLNYPELLAWENLWVRGRHELQAELYRKVKAINPALPIGWHVYQNVTFSPLERAEEDYAILAGFSDFIRPAVYNNCAGERFHAFASGTLGPVLGDLSAEESLDTLYHLLDYHEAPYDELVATGFSDDYVRRETRRAVDGVAGSATQVWPGIDIDVPVPKGASQCTPEGVRQAVRAAFDGGATGIILSRNYIEMKPDHLSAAGDALRELGLA
jgi:hypothetical protein